MDMTYEKGEREPRSGAKATRLQQHNKAMNASGAAHAGRTGLQSQEALQHAHAHSSNTILACATSPGTHAQPARGDATHSHRSAELASRARSRRRPHSQQCPSQALRLTIRRVAPDVREHGNQKAALATKTACTVQGTQAGRARTARKLACPTGTHRHRTCEEDCGASRARTERTREK